LFQTLINLTVEKIFPLVFGSNDLREIAQWNNEQLFFYFTGLALVILLTFIAFKQRLRGIELNRYIIVMPFLIALLFCVHYLDVLDFVDMKWTATLLMNFFILGFGINALIKGNRYKNVLYMFYGLIIISNLMWVRYFDIDIAFWLKGLFFIGVGLAFLFIHKLTKDTFEN
jgi:hypothetical protein